MGFNKVELVAGSIAQLTFESADIEFKELHKIAMNTIVELIALNEAGDSDNGDKPKDKKETLVKSEIIKTLGSNIVSSYQ